MENVNTAPATDKQETTQADFLSFIEADGLNADEPEMENSEVEETEVEDEVVESEIEEDDDAQEVDDDEADDEPDELEDEEEEESASAALDDDSEFVLNIGGEEVSVKGSELKSGYMRQRDYTQKTQEIASQRKEIEAERSTMVEQAGVMQFNAISKLKQFDDAIAAEGGWAEAQKKYTPEQLDNFTKIYVQTQNEAKVAEALISDYQTKQKASNMKAIKEVFTDMSKTVSGFNQETISELEKYAVAMGADPEELLQITQPYFWRMMLSAMKHDKLEAKRAKDNKEGKAEVVKAKVKKKPKSISGAKVATEKTGSRKYDQAVKRVKENGGRHRGPNSRQAGIEAFMEFLS